MVHHEASKSSSEECLHLLRLFVYEKLLKADHHSKSLVLLGSIQGTNALILAEKTPFGTDQLYLEHFQTHIAALERIDSNDVYTWMSAVLEADLSKHPSAKINIIWPASEVHIRKYSQQVFHAICETPDMYKSIVVPYIKTMTGSRLNWVYNILDGKTERESIIFEDLDPIEGFTMVPDMKWDRKNLDSLYLMVLVRRRDILSIRDLKPHHVHWLKKIRQQILDAVLKSFSQYIYRADELMLYIHYQPSYYHFHIHITRVKSESDSHNVVGRAISLSNIISQLELMDPKGNGFADATIEYVIGEESEIWKRVSASLCTND